MDATNGKQTARQEERELWLLLIGALLTGNKLVLDASADLEPRDAKDGAISGLLDSIRRHDKDRIWGCLQTMGIKRDDSMTCIEGIVEAIRDSVLRRECVQVANSLTMASLIERPEQWCEHMEKHVALIRARIRK